MKLSGPWESKQIRNPYQGTLATAQALHTEPRVRDDAEDLSQMKDKDATNPKPHQL